MESELPDRPAGQLVGELVASGRRRRQWERSRLVIVLGSALSDEQRVQFHCQPVSDGGGCATGWPLASQQIARESGQQLSCRVHGDEKTQRDRV